MTTVTFWKLEYQGPDEEEIERELLVTFHCTDPGCSPCMPSLNIPDEPGWGPEFEIDSIRERWALPDRLKEWVELAYTLHRDVWNWVDNQQYTLNEAYQEERSVGGND